MSKFRIEPEDNHTEGRCQDCDSTTYSVHGYIYKDDNARGVYYARWTKDHLERGVQMLLSVGRWGDGTNGKMRKALGVECRMGEDRPAFMLVDAATMPWRDESLLGASLTREEALANRAIKKETFDILDELIEQDNRIKAFLLSNRVD